MLDRRSSDGRDAEIYRVVGGRRQIFNAVHATEAFLYRLAALSVRRARELFPDALTVKVHFTVPAYESDDRDAAGAMGESGRYREHLKAAVRGFMDRPEFSQVEFRVVTGDRQWLYEPYGVYYYYAALESRIPLREAGATYLILDMGGSTTDLAVVQVNKRGTEFQQYPTCASIKLGGIHFDRFLLDRLSLRPFRGSAAERDEVLATIEEAKIAVSNGQAEAQFTIAKRKVTLTRAALEEALADFWTRGKDKTSLRGEIRAFLSRVREKAAQHRLFHAFDTFSGVFLAGGSTQLPGIRGLIQEELTALGMLPPRGGEFATPAPEVQPGSVTALGLAAETARFDPLERATAVYAHISDDVGVAYRFNLRGAARPAKDETLLYSKSFLDAEAALDGWICTPLSTSGKEAYERVPLPGNRVPKHVRVQLRNDAETEYQHDEVLPVSAMSPVDRDVPLEVCLRNHFKVVADGDGVRVKPIMVLHETGPGASRKPIRLRREDEGKSHVRMSYDVSLKPAPVAGDVHICIDFGMSNTSVALMAPGRDFPETATDLEVFAIGHGRVPAKKIVLPGPVVVALPDPLPLEPVEPQRQEPVVAPATADVAPLGSGIQGQADSLQLRTVLQEALRAGLAVSLEAAREAATAAVRGEVDAMERVLGRAFTELRAGLAADRSAGVAGSAVETARVPHPMERVEEEWLADSPLQLPRVPEDRFARLKSRPMPDSVEERFRAFLADVHPSLQYEPEVIRAVLSECESEGSRLVVLAGPPGTGKSRLVQVLAEFYNQTLLPEALTCFYLLQPVSPSWYSPASLQGGYSEVEGRFRETPFLSHLLRAQVHYEECVRNETQPRLSFICLDEFNLAHPEQYLADILSRMEADAESPQRVLTLCRRSEVPGLEKDITVRLTPNLKLFATLNVDASTHMLSPKILDRSHFVRLRPTLPALQRVAEQLSEMRTVAWFHASFVKLLPGLVSLCEEANTPIGYRALEQAYRYAAFCQPQDVDSVVDSALCSFLLSRLPAVFAVGSRGYGQQVTKFKDTCTGRYPSAANLLRRVAEGLPGQAV